MKDFSHVEKSATDLMLHTENFSHVTWRGRPVWQNILDLWCCQEIITRVRPRWIIETGSHQGGSALFYADLCDLLGEGEVISIDIDQSHGANHPRATFVQGSSVAADIVRSVRERVGGAEGPIFVTLDSDHREDHVRAELAAYADLVTSGSYLVVQDTCIDTLEYLAVHRPGPLGAVREFLASHDEFEVCEEFDGKYLFSHHPGGYLRRR